MTTEARITVNGVVLSQEQSLAVRFAIANVLIQLPKEEQFKELGGVGPLRECQLNYRATLTELQRIIRDTIDSDTENKLSNQGKWYFSCVRFDSMENSRAQAEYEDKVQLKASNEVGALTEAQLLWKKASTEVRKQWNEGEYPKAPRVFYEVPWPSF